VVDAVWQALRKRPPRARSLARRPRSAAPSLAAP